jgi:dTDP-4-dehydrorhamnose 3,5-epimerase-like enzyme
VTVASSVPSKISSLYAPHAAAGDQPSPVAGSVDLETLEVDEPADSEHQSLTGASPLRSEADTPSEMQRSASRGMFNSTPGGGSFFTSKAGAIDRHKVFLFALCSLLATWIFYDACCHYHSTQYSSAVRNVQDQRGRSVGDALPVGTVLRAPGAPDGQLPESKLFKYLPGSKSSFLNDAGVIDFLVQPEHQVKKMVNNVHAATILPGKTRGNHMHSKFSELLVLIQGTFLLRAAQLGNDGVWVSEDHIYEIGQPGNPFSGAASTISSTPIHIEIPANVCHAIRNLDPTTTAFMATYYIQEADAKWEEPNREVCRSSPKAFLKP